MRNLANKFEEFNLGRNLKFKGSKKNMTLFLVHGLDAKILDKTKKALKEKTEFKDVICVDFNNISKLLDYDPKSIYIYVVHLPLDEEINIHKEVSKWAFDHDIYQVNPYNKIAKIFDDKFLFYALMTANEIRQPFTLALHRNNKVLTEDEISKLMRYERIVVKPRHGTEKIDFAILNSKGLDVNDPAIQKILKYDDCLIQEYIEDPKETKALYLFGDIYIMDDWGAEQKNFTAEIVDVIDNFASSNQLIMPEIFSIDLMYSKNEILVLEANIRPAAIFKYKNWR